jgi:hypothetical protein
MQRSDTATRHKHEILRGDWEKKGVMGEWCTAQSRCVELVIS